MLVDVHTIVFVHAHVLSALDVQLVAVQRSLHPSGHLVPQVEVDVFAGEGHVHHLLLFLSVVVGGEDVLHLLCVGRGSDAYVLLLCSHVVPVGTAVPLPGHQARVLVLGLRHDAEGMVCINACCQAQRPVAPDDAETGGLTLHHRLALPLHQGDIVFRRCLREFACVRPYGLFLNQITSVRLLLGFHPVLLRQAEHGSQVQDVEITIRALDHAGAGTVRRTVVLAHPVAVGFARVFHDEVLVEFACRLLSDGTCAMLLMKTCRLLSGGLCERYHAEHEARHE